MKPRARLFSRAASFGAALALASASSAVGQELIKPVTPDRPVPLGPADPKIPEVKPANRNPFPTGNPTRDPRTPFGAPFAKDNTEDGRRTLGNRINNGGGASIVAPNPPAPQVTTITYTAVSPKRQWTEEESGRQILAHLLAFAAPKEGEPGPVVVIHNGNIRLLLDGQNRKPVDLPLARLSEEDREFVNQIAKAAKNGLPKPASGGKGSDEPEKAPYKPLSGSDKPDGKDPDSN